jgi:hypothetical protein
MRKRGEAVGHLSVRVAEVRPMTVASSSHSPVGYASRDQQGWKLDPRRTAIAVDFGHDSGGFRTKTLGVRFTPRFAICLPAGRRSKSRPRGSFSQKTSL